MKVAEVSTAALGYKAWPVHQDQYCLMLPPVCQSRHLTENCGVEMGPRPSPGGQSRREIPRTTGLVTDNPKQAAIPILPLYFPGKHLLSSLAQKLASNLPPHSCLRKKKVEKGHWEKEMEKEGKEREGQGQFPESHKAKQEPLAKTNKKMGVYPY
ncbi:hypothetical protein EYF80_015343 [Liparis tanakae]|uniref:Uncharacterized protein n=1 Tax=Liparis tanakae TaxID=230148 RepID=A0A4Z2IAR1_9TELE|nr:hypothetical protein EYF80_015343 [Liparis tanakae]